MAERLNKRGGQNKIEVQWDVVIRQLRAGHLQKEIAQFTVGCHPRQLTVKAKKELSAERFDEYTRLSLYNKFHSPYRKRAAKCGTTGGYYRHLRQKEVACPDCCAAVAKYQRELVQGKRRTKRKKPTPPKPEPRPESCGRCGVPLVTKPGGRPKKWCSELCRHYATRQRAKERQNGERTQGTSTEGPDGTVAEA